jgi:two-component system chemotaxis response regulator CheY
VGGMKELIDWLKKVERMAGEIYSKAANIFAGDAHFKQFLEHIAEEEVWHFHVMESAAEQFSSKPFPIPAIAIDEETNEKIQKIFLAINEQIENNSLSKESFLEKIAAAELSEWNEIFLYVVNYLKEEISEFKYPAIMIQKHRKEIESYLEQVAGGRDILNQLKKLPTIWTENILIIEDEDMVSGVIKALINREGAVDIARNGQEALTKLQEKYYKLIISDVDMPIMDGLTFYKKAIEQFPTIQKRVLFITGDPSNDKQAFFAENGLKFLAKPMKITELRSEAAKILLLK